MGSMIWWRSSVGTALQPLVLGHEFLAPDSRRKLRMTKPACRSRILAKSSGDVLAVRGSSSSTVQSENEGGGRVFHSANQVLQAPQDLDKLADGEMKELISRWTAGRRELMASSAAVFSAAVCACCVQTVGAAPDPDAAVAKATVEAVLVVQANIGAVTDALPSPEVEQATVEAATDALPPLEVEQATVEAAGDALPPPEVEQATVQAARQATGDLATNAVPPPEVEKVTGEAVTDPSPEVGKVTGEAVTDPSPPPEVEQATVGAVSPPEKERTTVGVTGELPPPEVKQTTVKAATDALPPPEVGQAQTLQDTKEKEKKDDKPALGSSEWSYGGLCGPATWGAVCAAGVLQSPIDIPVGKVKAEKPEDLIFDYNPVAPTFLNTGHGTMQVNFPVGRNRLRIGDRVLDLIQFHFHTPSEHTFDGVHYCMEAHLVHRDPISKSYAVVGVMLDAQSNVEPNRALQAALEYSPLEHYSTVPAPRSFKMSPALLLPPSGRNGDKRRYMHYSGSLTTPPCSEGVEWYVMETPIRVSSFQVLDFMKFVGDFKTYALNTRPVQPLGDRTIGKGKAIPLL